MLNIYIEYLLYCCTGKYFIGIIIIETFHYKIFNSTFQYGYLIIEILLAAIRDEYSFVQTEY